LEFENRSHTRSQWCILNFLARFISTHSARDLIHPAMAHRGLSLRYLAAKFAASAEEVAVQLQTSATSNLTEALSKGIQAWSRELTGVGIVTGLAMAPTLNSGALTQPDAMERFLMRLIPRPAAQRSVFDGDVVAFRSPLVSPGATPPVMVRRVAALEGEELVTDEPEEDESVVIPKVSTPLASSLHP
jgi:hypothetical protein